mmetsp:Transcript_12723/g.21443  ORF Transcript_12723/g.21443 Transcript_12723/m.21443 type:complete len:331 (-) Transcript_12723:63-1055(-)
MAERKVLIKYYPPDFDPTKLAKAGRARDKQDNVRMMLPMSVRCDTCGNFLYIGTKFNMRKETCQDIDYLGISVYRFYFKCTFCHSEITMRTDPKQHDYVCEHGATRNYEQWRDIAHAETILKAQRQLESATDAMKNLENKTYDSKKEMQILDALEEVRLLNKRKQGGNSDQLLLKVIMKNEREEASQRNRVTLAEQANLDNFELNQKKLLEAPATPDDFDSKLIDDISRQEPATADKEEEAPEPIEDIKNPFWFVKEEDKRGEEEGSKLGKKRDFSDFADAQSPPRKAEGGQGEKEGVTKEGERRQPARPLPAIFSGKSLLFKNLKKRKA